jgi:two-component system, OmpR family, response regulator
VSEALTTVLLVEDESGLSRLVRSGLSRAGYEVVTGTTGQDALTLAERPDVDVLVLDIGIPGPDGLQVVRWLRDRGDDRPVLLLTGRGAVEDRVRGLRAGADDYLPKPFALTELVARIDALVRRHGARRRAPLQVGSVEYDPEARVVMRFGRKVDLTARELDLLELFLRNPRQVLTRDQILERVWGMDADEESNVLAVYTKYLRDKLDRPFGCESLVTVRGLGYRWDPDDDEPAA